MNRVLTTLLRPDAGQARVAGFDVAGDSQRVRSAIGLAGQHAAVGELLTGRENLELAGLWHHLPGREYRRRAREMLELLSLTDAAAGSGPAPSTSGQRPGEPSTRRSVPSGTVPGPPATGVSEQALRP